MALAEQLGAHVLTDIRVAAAFPTDHELHPIPPVTRAVSGAARALVRDADVIVAFDWLDLGLLLQRVFGDDPVPSQVIEVSCDAHNHRGGSQDHGALPVCDLTLLCETDAGVHALLDALPDGPPAPGAPTARAVPAVDVPPRQRRRATASCRSPRSVA